jgi:ribonucleoside-diphosphate reductase alpha chain
MEEMVKEKRVDLVVEYFEGDELAADVWKSKYRIDGEKTPHDMHRRMAKELARTEKKYDIEGLPIITKGQLSEFGEKLFEKEIDEEFIMSYFERFRYIVPQGSIMTMLGNKGKIGSLSNCFVIPSPIDSYGGIMRTDQQLAQLMKRRGGVGLNINTLRPADTPVSNAAGTSTGAVSFMPRFSNTTREVAQNGRRGALMLLISVRHPDIFKFVNIKKDRTQVTGANISVMLTDEFMEAVKNDKDFLCEFPVKDRKFKSENCFTPYNYNELTQISEYEWIMRIKAKELFDMIVENAWENAEPGVAYIDRVVNYSPDGVYDQYRPIASNPCGEQWMQAYDACRLLALNLFSVVKNPFTSKSEIDYEKLYEIAYIQQRLADDIVDLEIEYVNRIIKKIENDSESKDLKSEELYLWNMVKTTAINSRRTGCGFTGLGDMLAALGIPYGCEASIDVVKKVMRKKMEAELDCTIDLAILRGEFSGWSSGEKEFIWNDDGDIIAGNNDFYTMLLNEFPDQVERMCEYGRRNVSWSTVAPTGTVSLMTQTTSGLEPLFMGFYMRRKKINPSDKGSRVDFVDQSGDSWQEFPVIHPKFHDWMKEVMGGEIDEITLDKSTLEHWFKASPWYGATANDIDWKDRIELQSVIQKYTTNAISCTINLPNDVDKKTVAGIYDMAWHYGLKGVTIYRDGCRSGVLVSETAKKSYFNYSDSIKRPKEINGTLHVITVKGVKYGVIIGIIDDKPYELFAFNLPEDIKDSCNGKIVKVKKGHYNFECEDGTIKNLQKEAVKSDELVLTRLVSGMLRHGAKPQFVMEQIDKCDLEVVSFGKAISRTLKKYVKDEEMVSRNNCKDCGSKNVRMQEGCLACLDCGSSKCG